MILKNKFFDANFFFQIAFLLLRKKNHIFLTPGWVIVKYLTKGPQYLRFKQNLDQHFDFLPKIVNLLEKFKI